MKSIELYINGQLCDLGNPDDLSVYMKRHLLSPSELSSKDTQRSYDITLPASATNNTILKHTNAEEVKGKFSNEYDATLIIGGVKVFEGKFKLNEITAKEYRGNLGTPQRTIKDIFGDTNMNEIGTWEIPFTKLEDITKYNREKNPDFFFPLVMYGLLPKVPKGGLFSGKKTIDNTNRLGVEDMPASLNCLAMLRKIFENKGVSLSGSAFADQRLSKLYVSYKNPTDYTMPWNYGDLSKMSIKGVWSNMELLGAGNNVGSYEKNVFITNHPVVSYGYAYSANILNCRNAKHWEKNGESIAFTEKDLKDWTYENLKPGYIFSGNYISENKQTINDGKESYSQYSYSIRIPQSGYYKVHLKGNLFIPFCPNVSDNHKDYNTGLQPPFTKYSFKGFRRSNDDKSIHYSAATDDYGTNKILNRSRYELKLIRDRADANFNLETGLDGTYFKGNYDQEWELYKNNNSWPTTTGQGYFPYIEDDVKKKGTSVLFVDQAQNPDLVVGFSWGRFWDQSDKHKDDSRKRSQQHIGDHLDIDDNNDKALWATVLAAKSTYSWDHEIDKDSNKRSRVIIHNPNGYGKYKIYDGTLPTLDPGEEADDDDSLKEYKEGQLVKLKVKNFKMSLLHSPTNPTPCTSYARRGYYRGIAGEKFKALVEKNSSYIGLGKEQCADGEVNAIVWFEKGERLTLVSSTDYGKKAQSWLWHMLDFELSISPYRIDKTYANLNEYTGESLSENPFYWEWNNKNDSKYAFRTKNIDLIKFLPSNVKVDDWINNFCKAFNLDLVQNDKGDFELNVKRDPRQSTSLVIDLDQKANVTVDRKNVPLGLSGTFRLGFTCDKDEIGYYNSTLRYNSDGSLQKNPLDESVKQFDPEDGGGTFRTGSPETSVTEQKSNFSYNWMMDMKVLDDKNTTTQTLPLPVISDKEVWGEDNGDYSEMMLKSYTDKAQRFWYKDDKTFKTKLNDRSEVEVGLIKNALTGANPMSLDYKDKPNSIMQNYFTILTDADNCYTTIECYLSPEEYAIADRALVRFNGDMYHIAEIDGYDPLGKKKATIKLIRKIL